jgi:thiamine-monophosphate kinase
MPGTTAAASLARLGEFGLIRRLCAKFGRTGPSVIQGIGDDTAIIRPNPGRWWLLTTDLLAEGIHFKTETATCEDIGYRAAVANLSDIAAMGGVPHYLLASIAIPAGRSANDIDRLYRGLMRACRRHRVDLVGGDTSASRHGLMVSIALIGSVEPGRALTRDAARVGDAIYVTGTLGDALAGLALLSAQRTRSPGSRSLSAPHRRYLMARHLRPTPRLLAGRLLATRRLATAAIDLSDGLSGDLAHICEQSGVGAEIEAAALPLSPACRAYAASRRMDPSRLALTGGEDYELLFTVPPRHEATLRRLSGKAGCRFTRIGRIRAKAFGQRLRRPDGTSQRLAVTSYRHFEHPVSTR